MFLIVWTHLQGRDAAVAKCHDCRGDRWVYLFAQGTNYNRRRNRKRFQLKVSASGRINEKAEKEEKVISKGVSVLPRKVVRWSVSGPRAFA